MQIKSYRARSVQEALAMVRADLGPDAAVLHTREVQPGMMRWLGATRQIEVMATAESESVPSRITAEPQKPAQKLKGEQHHRFLSRLAHSATEGMGLIETAKAVSTSDVSARLRQLLLAQQWSSDRAEELLQRVLMDRSEHELTNDRLLHARMARTVEEQLPACRPIQIGLSERRIVALVGPTGVGKTTTIAKLAANFRVRQRKRVGLITVDTYRIAAVDQLRTYAEIIDLPMEIVSTAEEMQAATEAMAGLDLILIDTAGQSPHDIARLHKLRSVLAGAPVSEVHLVLSTAASASTLIKTVEQFQSVGVTSLLLTKLDEAYGLGNIASLIGTTRFPFSYLTHGQNVPDDIAPAERGRLARALVGFAPEKAHA